MSSLPRLPSKLASENQLSVTGTGLKTIDIIVPSGKIWRILGFYLSGGGDGNTVTSTGSLRILAKKKAYGSSTASAYAEWTFYNDSDDHGGTAGVPIYWPDSYDTAGFGKLWVQEGETLRARFNVSAYTSTETYALIVYYEEFDILGAQTEQF